jgi:hypothetical protein
MGVQEIRKGLECIYLVRTATGAGLLWVPQNSGEFLTSWETNSF